MAKTILILAANPKNTPQLRLDQEIREIDNGLERAQKRSEFTLKQKLAARPVDVRRAMLDYKPNIVHFCGHGSGEEGLAFEDENGQANIVTTEALAGFFELFADRVECVVLNACYSQVQAEAIAEHIAYVIGMKKAIGDAAAIEFAVAFYDALGAGESVEFAYKLACNAIQWAGIPEHLTPTLKLKAQAKLGAGTHRNNARHPVEDKRGDKDRYRPMEDLDMFEEMVSRDTDVDRIKVLINDHKSILDGVVQYSGGSPLVENAMDFPVSETLIPDFTRFLFQTNVWCQFPNLIIFIDFLSPKDSVFLEGTTKSQLVEKSEKDIMSYINFVKANYDSYCKRAVMLDKFSIPLSTLHDTFRTMYTGVLVVGRRKYLTADQLNYLSSENNWMGRISIITYDALIEHYKLKAKE